MKLDRACPSPFNRYTHTVGGMCTICNSYLIFLNCISCGDGYDISSALVVGACASLLWCYGACMVGLVVDDENSRMRSGQGEVHWCLGSLSMGGFLSWAG